MAIPNSTFTQILSTSLYNRSGKTSDNIAKRNALYQFMKKKGNIRKVGGGESIVRPIEYAENSTYTRYTAAQYINTNPQEIVTSVKYPWRQIAMSIQQNGLEDIQNAGKEQLVDLLATKEKNAVTTFVNTFSGDLYSEGIASSGLQVGGLQYVIADDPTTNSEVGGINQSLQSWWQNIYKTTSTAVGFGAVASATNIRKYVENMYLAGLRDGQACDLLVSDNSLWQYYTEALRAIQRIGTDEKVSDGILSIRVYNADYLYDGGADGQCPSSRMYFINSDFLYLCVSSKRPSLTPIPGKRQPYNQDVDIQLLGWAGNLVCTSRRAQAVMIDA